MFHRINIGRDNREQDSRCNHAAYPAIYHLRQELMTESRPDFSISWEAFLEDIRDQMGVKVSFDSEDLDDEEKLSVYHSYLEDRLQIPPDLKAVHDWGILAGILHGSGSIPEARSIEHSCKTCSGLEAVMWFGTGINHELVSMYAQTKKYKK